MQNEKNDFASEKSATIESKNSRKQKTLIEVPVILQQMEPNHERRRIMNEYVIFECAISIAIVAYVWFWQIASLRRDNFRSDIRRLRDNLFDFMWENGYDFSMPAYMETRQTLNGMLRLSNSLSVPKLFLILFFGAAIDRYHDRLPDSLDKVKDTCLREKIKKVRHEAVKRMLHFVLLEGIPGVLFRFIVRLTRYKNWVSQKSQRLLVSAYELGSPSLSTQQRAVLH